MTKRSIISRICRKQQQQPPYNNKQQVTHDDDNMVLLEEDRISNLGDDILVSIISRLTTREAIATSVLSSRWQPLHTRVSRLNLFPEVIQPSDFEKENESLVREKFRKHMKRVNRTLNSYEDGLMLNELRIHMHRIEGPDIQSWLNFALSRQVQILDIRMIHVAVQPIATYSLQLEKNLLLINRGGLKSLRELSLCFVDVNDLEIKLLVSNFPNLETLSIQYSNLLRHISIVGHPKLQHLNLSHLIGVESIEIENVLNLISLRCFSLMQIMKSPSIDVVRLNNLPNLVDLNTNDNSYCFLLKLPSFICSQLMVFRVSTHTEDHQAYPFPKLINVKHLELEFKESDNWQRQQGHEAHSLVYALLACKSLETLQLKSVWHQFDHKAVLGVRDGVYTYDELEWSKVSPKLNKVKLSGYLGRPGELEFALYIIRRAAGLKELIVEPACRASKLIRQVAIANLWEQLGPIIPNSLNLVVI